MIGIDVGRGVDRNRPVNWNLLLGPVKPTLLGPVRPTSPPTAEGKGSLEEEINFRLSSVRCCVSGK